jgi:hypothetical protein
MFPYDPETMPPAPREVTVYRSDDEIQRWIDQRSTPESRKRNERRVRSFRRLATTPSKLRADTYIGRRIGGGFTIASRGQRGYIVENATLGFASEWTMTEIRLALATKPSAEATTDDNKEEV